MEYNDIRELAELMNEMGLTSLAYRNGDESVKLTRRAENQPTAQGGARAVAVEHRREGAASAGAYIVKSPMVGVYYSAPGADEDAYVELGDTVQVGDVLCIIETMKIMNEITAERDGVITEICVQNKDVVEFGQPLFRIGNAGG